MSLTNTPSRRPKANPPLGREELAFVTLAGSLPLEAISVYDQMEAWLPLIQMEQQPIFSLFEAQPHDTGEQLITQSAPMARRNYAMGRRSRPVCAYCNKDFGRVQELKRHLKDVHMPRCRCPFCNYTWTRPNKIKAHLMADHIDKFTAEMLDGIKDLYGQRIIEFVNAYHSGPHIEVTYAIPGTGQVPFDPTQLCSTGAFPSGADHVLRHPETPQPPMSWHLATPSTHQELVPFLREPHVDPPHHFLESCSPHYDMIYYV